MVSLHFTHFDSYRFPPRYLVILNTMPPLLHTVPDDQGRTDPKCRKQYDETRGIAGTKGRHTTNVVCIIPTNGRYAGLPSAVLPRTPSETLFLELPHGPCRKMRNRICRSQLRPNPLISQDLDASVSDVCQFAF